MAESTSERDANLNEALARLSTSIEDREAWAMLYERLWPFVFASLYRLLKGKAHLAEDCAQEVFLRLLSHSYRYDLSSVDRFRIQVWRTCRDQARNILRQEQRRREYELSDRIALSLFDEKQFGQPDVVESVEIQLLTEEARKYLTADEVTLLNAMLEDRSLSDLASQFDISYKAAAVRVHRLKAKLRNILMHKDL